MKNIIVLFILILIPHLSSGQQVSLVADINSSKFMKGINALNMFTFKGKIYFITTRETVEYDGHTSNHSLLTGYNFEYNLHDSILYLSRSSELWSYNGKTLKRLNGFLPGHDKVEWHNNALFFIESTSKGENIWIWQGSDCHLIASLAGRHTSLIPYKNNLYIISDHNYKYNNTDSLVIDTLLNRSVEDPIVYNSNFLFRSDNKLYLFDGINKPAALTKLTTQEEFSVNSRFYLINDSLYFYGYSGIGQQRIFLKYDGQQASITDLLDNFNFQLDTAEINYFTKTINADNKIYLARYNKLWIIDGIHNPFIIPYSGNITHQCELENIIYLVDYYGSGSSLVRYYDGFKSDELKIEATVSSSPSNLTVFKDKLYFFAKDSIGSGLYVYDGQSDPTLVQRLTPNPRSIITAKSRLYIIEENDILPWDGQHEFLKIQDYNSSYWTIGDQLFIFKNKNLWIYDGLSEKIFVLDNINNIRGCVLNDILYFFVSDDVYSCRIYKAESSGNISEFYSSNHIVNPDRFINHNNKLYFIASDNSLNYIWETDSLNEPQKIIDIKKNTGSSDILFPVYFKDRIMFLSGNYLWSYDFKDSINQITNFKGNSLFCTDDFLYLNLDYYTCWVYDGEGNGSIMKSLGTVYYLNFAKTIKHTDYLFWYDLYEKDQINNVQQIDGIYTPGNFKAYKNDLYFTAFRAIEGTELCKLSVPDTIMNITACNSYGKIRQSGIYFDTIPRNTGIDSINKLKITISHPVYTDIQVTANDSYDSPSARYRWSESGIYLDTIPGISGCDSILTINLKITHNTFSTLKLSACESYSSPSGKLLTESGTYWDTIPNTAGFDSVITLSLKINHASESTNYFTACNQYKSPDGHLRITSGDYTDTIPNTYGCDSVIHYNLQIDHVDTTIEQNGNALISIDQHAGHRWINLDNANPTEYGDTSFAFLARHNGRYAVILTQGSCIDTSSVYTIIVTKNEENISGNIQLYPNPTNGKVTIDLGKIYDESTVTVMNSTGIIVQEIKVKNTQKAELNLNEPGMYLVKVRTKEGETVHRLIKQ